MVPMQITDATMIKQSLADWAFISRDAVFTNFRISSKPYIFPFSRKATRKRIAREMRGRYIDLMRWHIAKVCSICFF